MNLREFLSDNRNEHTKAKNPNVRCNALSKTARSFNCQLSPDQATELARYLLDKAQLIRRNRIDDAAVQLWNAGINSETLLLGLMPLRKGPRRKKSVKKHAP